MKYGKIKFVLNQLNQNYIPSSIENIECKFNFYFLLRPTILWWLHYTNANTAYMVSVILPKIGAYNIFG